MILNHSQSGLLGSEFRLPFGELLGGDFAGLFRINLRKPSFERLSELGRFLRRRADRQDDLAPPDLFRLEAELLINPEDELQGLGLALAALAVAALCTWIATDDSDKAEIAEPLEGAVSGESEHEEPRGIDWDSLSQEIVAWMEVPSTNISQPVARPDKRNPKAYLYLDALGQGGCGTPYIDADCTEESLLVPICGRSMSDGSAFADFTKYSEEDYARSHSRVIFLHTRDGGTYELSVIAMDVVDASAETVCPSFDDPSAIAEWIGKSDLVLLEYDGSSKVFAFATCSYQTVNS